jgi:uncharacterized protein
LGIAVKKLTIETRVIKQIPVFMCLPESSEPCPVVFYIPGFTSQKRDGISLAYQLAQEGIACIGIDPLYHGDRYDVRLVEGADAKYGGIYPRESGLDIFLIFMEVIEQSALDVATLLNVLEDDPRIDVQRAGVTGMSMGAWASFLAFANIQQLKTAVPMMGIPTFTRRWLDLVDECAWSNLGWKQVLAQLTDEIKAHTNFITRYDPATALYESAPRPLLIMNGDFDTDMIKTYTLDWYRDAKRAWDLHPENLQWNVYPVGHTVTSQMEHDTVMWFVKHVASE